MDRLSSSTRRARNALNALAASSVVIPCKGDDNVVVQRQFENLILIDDRQSLSSILIIHLIYQIYNQVTNGRYSCFSLSEISPDLRENPFPLV